MSELRVLIAGAGIAGLTLAQGLRREGIECEVFEREPLDTWRTGYLLNLDVEGDVGLAACLPPALYELFVRASGETMEGHDLSVVVDPAGNQLTAMKHVGAAATGDRPPTNIDRRTFREILLAGLDDVVSHGTEVLGVELSDESVEVQLAGGRTATGDVLIAADGVGSSIRRQLMPDVGIIAAPVGALGLFGRAPLTEDVEAALPASVWNAGFCIVSDGRGTMLGVGHWRPRQAAPDAATELGIGGRFEAADPYVMLNGAIPPGVEVPPPPEWTDATAGEMHATMLAAVSGWHPVIHRLVEQIEPATLFSHPFRRLDPPAPWPSTRVSYVGDAITAMLPTLGKGANMAIRNAAVLRDQLVAADRGERTLLEAIGAYEADMRAATYPLMELAADHGRFGGGGLRKPGGSASESDAVPA